MLAKNGVLQDTVLCALNGFEYYRTFLRKMLLAHDQLQKREVVDSRAALEAEIGERFCVLCIWKPLNGPAENLLGTRQGS